MKMWINSFAIILILGCSAIAAINGMEQLNAAKGPYYDSNDVEWVNSAVVVAHPGMIARHDYMGSRQWTNEELLDFIKDFDPDSIQCWFGIPFARSDIARSRGVAVCGGMEYEWESGIHGFIYFEDAIFKGNGIGVTEKGSLAVQRRYQTRGMTHMAPKWHEVLNTGNQRCAVLGDSIFQDNIIHGMRHPYGQFDDYSNRFFLEYLEKNFTEKKIKELGVDLNNFHIRKYLQQLRKDHKSNEEICDDPVIHEYIRYHYVELTKKMIHIVNQSKIAAVKAGRAVPAWYGNQSAMTSFRSFGIPLSQFVDVIAVEHSEFAQPCHRGKDRMDAFSTLLYKNSDAAGNYKKPVWTFTYDKLYTNLYRRLSGALASAEASANGGLHVQCMKREIPEGSFRDVNRHHAQLVSRNRVFFTDRERIAKVGLIRSLPSECWGFFSSLSYDRPHLKHFGTAARVLEDSHILYEVAIFGHPDLFDDLVQLKRLDKYDTLILPHVDCITNYQIERLTKWAHNGGKLILWGNCGERDEERKPLEQNAFDDLISNPGKGEIVKITLDDAEKFRNMEGGMLEKLASVIKRPEPVLKTDIDKSVWFNVYRHGAGPMLTVAMINYDIQPLEDIVHPKKDFSVSIKVDDPDIYQKAYYIHDNYKTYGADVPDMMELPLERKGDYLSVQIPTIDIIGVVALAGRDEFEARKYAAEVRKWHDRFGIAKRARWQQITPSDAELLKKSKRLLSCVQGNAKVNDFAQIANQCREMAYKLRSQVKQVTMDVVRKNKDSMLQNIWSDSDYKFDFGTENNVPYGWKAVTDQTVYLDSRGYGWTEAEYLKSVKCDTGDALHGDYVRSQNPREQLPGLSFHYPFILPPNWEAKFRVDISNGEYIITVICGDEEAHYCQNKVGITYVDAQGQPALYGDRVPMGFYQNRSFRVNVDQEFLELRFWGRNVGPLYANDCDWLVNGLIIHNVTEQLPNETTKSLALSDIHNKAVIRKWSVIGPFEDKDCMGLDVDYPAQQLDLEKQYDGKYGVVQWQAIPTLEGLAPTVHFSDNLFASDNENKGLLYESYTPGIEPSVGLAATFVYVPKDIKAVIKSSSTQMAIGYVNGKEVFRDEYIAGVLPHEDSVEVDMKKGWNNIMLKTTCHWGDEWASWLALYTMDGMPLKELPGVRISERPGE